jgi:hypothetical protein
MKKNAENNIQFTVRNVPAQVAKALKRKAKNKNTSLNQTLVEALKKDVDDNINPIYHDLDPIIGSWVDDEEFDSAIADQDQIDESIWK